jgi:catechol-2,3-dioxygenase
MRLGSIVLDSNKAEELADFYVKLLGWNKEKQEYEKLGTVFQVINRNR